MLQSLRSSIQVLLAASPWANRNAFPALPNQGANLVSGHAPGPTPAAQGSTILHPTVDLGYSQYQGTGLRTVHQYLGLRYAAPAVEDLRWRAPADPRQTTELQNATSFGCTCLRVDGGYPSEGQDSEDCLFINVWTPADATARSKLPVWVYIQGGGYEANTNANYNGTKVVEESGGNILLVNFNYRVGVFGFLGGESVREDGDLNVGLLDQRKALEWVQKYIGMFGGNPEHVVIHGTSAGAGSVALHLTAYGGRDDKLFIGAIGQSPFFPAQPKCSGLDWQFKMFARQAGCVDAKHRLKCLRSLDIVDLQGAHHRGPYPGRESSPRFYFHPCVDGELIQDHVYSLFEQGKFIHLPIMVGDDTDEGSFFASNAESPSEMAEFMKDNYPHLTSTDTDLIVDDFYPLRSSVPHHSAYFPSLSAAFGDCTFVCPTLSLASALASRQHDPRRVFAYRVNIQDRGFLSAGLGVPHTMETPAIFGVGYGGGEGSSLETYNAPIVPVVMHYWISFVRNLDPNVWKWDAAPVWLSYAEGERLVLETGRSAMEKVSDEQLRKCAFWKSLAGRMEL